MPTNTKDVLRRYKKVLVPELNTGQLRRLLRLGIPDRRCWTE